MHIHGTCVCVCVHAVLEARNRRAVLGCPGIWLLLSASCHLSASQATGLLCLNSSTGQVVSDSTRPLLDTGVARISGQRPRDTSRPHWAESFRSLLSGPQELGWQRKTCQGDREFVHPPHPEVATLLSSPLSEQRSGSSLDHSCHLPISPTLRCGHL